MRVEPLTRSGLVCAGLGGIPFNERRNGVGFAQAVRSAELGPRLEGSLARLKRTEEPVFDLVTNNFAHLENLVEVTNGNVRLTRRAEQIAFVSAKTVSPVVAPWLEV